MPLVFPGEEVSLNEPGRTFRRHHHLCGYAALLVSGSCDEAGDSGRFQAVAGDVLIHDSFHGHADWIGARGAVIFNIHLTRPVAGRFGRVTDADAIARAFHRDPREAEDTFHEQFMPVPNEPADWPDLLAQDLAAALIPRLDDWARSIGIHPGSLSRGFRLAYGITPQRYRLEQMAARAARQIRIRGRRLADIAAESGFADQAHMTRTLVGLFGATPVRLRWLR
jgi:AraC-like DNA-binding protein